MEGLGTLFCSKASKRVAGDSGSKASMSEHCLQATHATTAQLLLRSLN